MRMARVGPPLTPGCQIGHVDHTGCHQLVLSSIRPTRVVTPGCQIGYVVYVDHTGCHRTILAVIDWCS
jgi:hypothetical protein